MFTDPFAALTCAQTVGPIDALLRGVPDGACVEYTLTPLTMAIGLVIFGVAIAALQALVRAMVFGRADPNNRPNDRGTTGPSLREAANRARAAQLPD